MLEQLAMTLFILSALGTGGNTKFAVRYDVGHPDEVIELPAILNEVSGLTDINNQKIACVQDELGIVFIVSLKDGSIMAQYEFEPFGDFEGLTYVDRAFYVLRSDGRLTIIPDYRKPNEHINVKENLPTKNNEGLGYDKRNNRLLIAAKSKPTKESMIDRNNRVFYQFKIDNAELDKTPVFALKMEDIEERAKQLKVKLPVVPDKKINFSPSSIAVHPVSELLYIISAKDHLLLVCDQSGEIKHIEVLEPKLYPKAEGITFLPDNTMIITNEAKDKAPTLLKFRYQGS